MSDDRELKMRCLELAATLRRGRMELPVANDVVETATVLYDYVNAQSQGAEKPPAANPDKPEQTGKRKPRGPDILS